MFTLGQQTQIKSSGSRGTITEIESTIEVAEELSTVRYKVLFWLPDDPLFSTFEDWFDEGELESVSPAASDVA